MLKARLTLLFLVLTAVSRAASILIPMDEDQKNHLKAYGITYWALKNGFETDWLLNYRGGSFLMKYTQSMESECKMRGVSYEVLVDGMANVILNEVTEFSVNVNMVRVRQHIKLVFN